MKHNRESNRRSTGKIIKPSAYQRVTGVRDSREKLRNEFSQFFWIALVLGMKLLAGSYDWLGSGFSDPPVQ